MLNDRMTTNNASADPALLDSFMEDLLHHKRQNSEDSGVGEGKFSFHYHIQQSIFFLFIGRNSMSRTPDALSSTDYTEDPLFLNQPGTSK